MRWNQACGALVVLAVMINPLMALGQTIGPFDYAQGKPSVSSSQRPWVGFSLGTGFLGGNSVEPDNSRDVGLTLDIPLQPTTRIRVGSGRMWVNGADFGEFPLRRLTVEGVALVPFPSPRRACQSHFVVGGGLGLYHYGLDDDFSTRRKGYQLFAGGECVGTRASFALEITGRSIRGPQNLQLPDLKLFALDMHFAVKLRL